MIDTKELRRLAQAATPGPWKACRNHECYEGAYFEIDPEDEAEYAAKPFTRIEARTGVVAAAHDLFEFDREDAEFIAAANPAVINEILDRLEVAEKERDNYKSAYNEWSEKTEWIQRGIDDGSIPPRYLGWHRADVVADLLNAVVKERDGLLADVETAHAQMMTSVAAVREACAKACEKLTKPSGPVPGHPIDAWLLATLDCAEVIRAGGKCNDEYCLPTECQSERWL